MPAPAPRTCLKRAPANRVSLFLSFASQDTAAHEPCSLPAFAPPHHTPRPQGAPCPTSWAGVLTSPAHSSRLFAPPPQTQVLLPLVFRRHWPRPAMAPEDHEGATSLLQSFERRFLAARALPSFPWQVGGGPSAGVGVEHLGLPGWASGAAFAH